MIDEIRRDLQTRLDQLMDEAERLRNALAALGGSNGAASRRVRASRPRRTAAAGSGASRPKGRTARSSNASASPATRGQRSSAASRSSARGRTANGAGAGSGGTKGAVLEALASGKAMTASEVAAATGLDRASVSTTLSKLAKSGDVGKATRGYELVR